MQRDLASDFQNTHLSEQVIKYVRGKRHVLNLFFTVCIYIHLAAIN